MAPQISVRRLYYVGVGTVWKIGSKNELRGDEARFCGAVKISAWDLHPRGICKIIKTQ